MAFRDLGLFNQALLAKQAWRLIDKPDSLCARLLKARYFPNANLMDTTFVKNPPPGWKGITHGLELLKKGAVWHINNRKKIRIWRDNWIPRGNLKVAGNSSDSRMRWVCDLINRETKQWKEELVRLTFHDHDAEEILKIQIPNKTAKIDLPRVRTAKVYSLSEVHTTWHLKSDQTHWAWVQVPTIWREEGLGVNLESKCSPQNKCLSGNLQPMD
jgi:hypothetical protein